MLSKYLKCGIYGWCIELLWTGLLSFFRHDPLLRGNSSLYMFPIYGTAAIISPLSHVLKNLTSWIRGFIYMCGIFFVEYQSGKWLKKRGKCPWDYSQAKWNIHGLIRLDFAPLWFLTGLFYERILRSKNCG